jgi:hypothetical protein
MVTGQNYATAATPTRDTWAGSVCLSLLAAMLGCMEAQPEPTAVADPERLTPAANVAPDVVPTPVPDPLGCTGYPEPRVWLESQAWWSRAGLAIPEHVGEHIHVGLCWPVAPDGGDALITDNKLHVDVRVLLHAATGPTSYIRVSDASNVKVKKALVLGPGDAEAWVPFDLDLSKWGTGRREFRWTANVPRTDEGLRQFNSTGWQLCVRSCASSYRSGPWTEARGWYEGRDYTHARFLSKLPVQPVSGLWTFNVRLIESGPGGVFVDPDFHNGSWGTRIGPEGGPFSGSVTLDTRLLANGPHRLALVASDGQNAGVQVVNFTVAN